MCAALDCAYLSEECLKSVFQFFVLIQSVQRYYTEAFTWGHIRIIEEIKWLSSSSLLSVFVCTSLPVAAAPKHTQFHPHLKLPLRGFPGTLSGWTFVTSRLGYSSVTVTFVGQSPFLYVCPWLEGGQIGKHTHTKTHSTS